MTDAALADLADHGWYLYMLWQDPDCWGATVRDALVGTCQHHATGHGPTPAEAIQAAMEKMALKEDDAERTTVAIAAPVADLLKTLGLTKPREPMRRI